MLIVYILIFIVVFIYLLFIKNRYQSFVLREIKYVFGNRKDVIHLLNDIEKDSNSTTYKDFNTKIKVIYDKVFGFLNA